MSANEKFWARRADRPATTPQQDHDYLLHRVEKLTLINRALWEILAKKCDCHQDDLVAKVAEIDLRDGELDNELHQPVIDCPQCGRRLNGRHGHCLYCGFEDLQQDVFTSV